MKVAVVGADDLGQWDAARRILWAMSAEDTLVHTGGDGIGYKLDWIAKHAKGLDRKRLPKIAVQLPEVGRYEGDELVRQHAMQIIAHHLPDVLLYLGDGLDPLAQQAQAFAGAYPRMAVYEWADWVRQRSAR